MATNSPSSNAPGDTGAGSSSAMNGVMARIRVSAGSANAAQHAGTMANTPPTYVPQLDPQIAAFAAALDALTPQRIERSQDRVANTWALHEALNSKWQLHAAAAAPGTNHSIDLSHPLALLHRVDPNNPYRWWWIDSGTEYGSNVYEVTTEAGVKQCVNIYFE